MARRFIIVPEGTFTDVSDWESVELVPDELPASLYLDFDPSQGSTLTKDGSDYVSSWRSALGSEDLNVAASGSSFPKWVASGLGGYPVIDCNDGGLRSIYSSADVLHDLATGYGWAMVVEASASSSALWATSTSGTASASAFVSSNRVWRNASSETVTLGTGLLSAGFHVLVGSYNPTGHALNYWQDGEKLGGFTSAGAPTSSRKLLLGWNTVFSARVKYARVMWFNATLSDQQAATVGRILAQQYGL